MRYSIIIVFLFNFFAMFSQEKKTQALDTVFLESVKIVAKSVGQKTTVLSKNKINNYSPQLTEILNFETPIYFKENGLGMVSSPSFRGTTAQQTSVVWNGININSQFLGQTDFNTISTTSFDEVVVRPGGGSTQFGTGTIGGSINLNNNFSFNKQENITVNLNYGSFNTKEIALKASTSTSNLNINGGLAYFDSDNDYKFVNSNKKNENGEFYNKSVFLNGSYKFNTNQQLKLYTSLFDGLRHFSILETTQTRTKYKDENLRLMLEYNGNFNKFFLNNKIALIKEDYTYFPELTSTSNLSTGNAISKIIKNEFGYKIDNTLLLKAFVNYNNTIGKGTNYNNEERSVLTTGAYFKHNVNKNLVYQVTVSNDNTSKYESPLLFTLGSELRIAPWYKISINSSKNYRVPTFNDLFWPGAGNPDLKPESSLQYELTNTLNFNNLTFKLTGYYNNIKDLIVWLPVSGSVWKPTNTNKVLIKGIEVEGTYSKLFGNHYLKAGLSYAYTRSLNRETNRQLTYVPYHKMVFSILYNYKRVNFSINNNYTGAVYTQTDNNKKTALDPYLLTNLKFGVALDTKEIVNIGFKIKNAWNTSYQSVAYKPMPLRNYQLYITLNI